MARMEAVSGLATPASETASRTHEVAGLGAATEGYRWSSANLLEKAVAGRPDISNRFNLAAVYSQTGRNAEAAAIYRQLVNDGQYVWATTRRDAANPNALPRRFNVADESARRLALLDNRLTFAATTTAASAAGVPAAAVVGGPAVGGRISDEEALRRDGIAP